MKAKRVKMEERDESGEREVEIKVDRSLCDLFDAELYVRDLKERLR